ncbi:MAG: EAL domain-containing protein, partial [Henriciella sp.]|uniref:EAL domain-containing protein n=1 Tax=Henriciella sp. TaxID=1968823 RepID=UPI003C793756
MRFEVALPVCAALLGLVLSTLFALIYVSAADYRAKSESEDFATRIVDAIEPALAEGDTDAARNVITSIAGDKAVLLDMEGNLLAGERNPVILRQGKTYSIGDGETTVAQLFMLPLIPSRLPLPLTTILASILMVSAVAYALTNYFAKVAGSQTRLLSETVDRLRNGLSSRASQMLMFNEFRFLRTKIVRAYNSLQADNDRLRNAAYTDERTGLGNSLSLAQELTSRISTAIFEEPAAFILIDANGLEQVSASGDSALGNELYVAMGRRLANFVSSREKSRSLQPGSWKVFALQSDEFAILIDQVGARPEVMRLVRDLIDSLRQPYEISGKTCRVPASIGIVMIPEDGQSAPDIRKRAHSALFQARRNDTADFQFYSPKFDRQDAARKRLEAEVRIAVEQKRFIPVFQPKIDLRTGRIVGAEALARWKLESGRIVSPNVFIPVAEATGLIGEIGTQITRQACRAAARWHRLGFTETSIAVNVSPLQFESEDLGSMMISAM